MLLILAARSVNRLDLIQCDTELVLLGAGRDVLDAARVDIRVDAHAIGARIFFARRCARSRPVQLHFDVEAVDASLQRVLDFVN